MIDSIIYYAPETKVGNFADVVADLGGSKLSKFAKSEGFDLSAVFPCKIITKAEVVDKDGNVTSPKEFGAGFAFVVASDDREIIDLIWALPNNLCRAQFDRASGKVVRTRIPLATLRTLSFEPVPLGSGYNFKSIEQA